MNHDINSSKMNVDVIVDDDDDDDVIVNDDDGKVLLILHWIEFNRIELNWIESVE